MPPRHQDSASSRSQSRPDSFVLTGEEETERSVTDPAGPEENEMVTVDQAEHEEMAAASEGYMYTPLVDLGLANSASRTEIETGAGQSTGVSVFMALPPNSTDTGTSSSNNGRYNGDADADHDNDNDNDNGTASSRTICTNSAMDGPNAADTRIDLHNNGTRTDLSKNNEAILSNDTKDTLTTEVHLPHDENDAPLQKLPVANDPKRKLPDIDADAVRRAVQNIRLKAPNLTTHLDKGCSEHGGSFT